MKVCVVDFSGPFGPLKSFVELIEPLSRLGITCEFMVNEPSVELLRHLAPEVDVHVIEGGHSIGRDLAVGRRIRKLRSEGLDAIHANTTSAARGALLGVIGTKTPMLVHLRNSRLSRSERLFLIGLAKRRRTGFVAVSEGAASEAGASARGSAVLMDPASEVLPRDERPLENPPRIGVVANQQPTKGFDIFVDVAENLASKPVKWEIFGSAGIDPPGSPYIAENRERLSRIALLGEVEFHGIVPSLAPWYRELDIMLVTSRRESFSRICVEAMLAGTPLIAPSIPGLIETVDGGRFATMFEAGDGDGAAAAVTTVLSHYEEALATAAAARRHALAHFDPLHVATRLAEIYRAIP